MNKKGGVGKTTSVINLAYQASLKGKTLMLDCDPQGDLSKGYGVEDPDVSIYDVFLKKNIKPISVRKNLDLIPATVNFAGADLAIQNEFSRETILKKQLDKYSKDYDFAFIDCPPSLNLITINALCSADYVIIPIEAAAFSISGVKKMIDFITSIKDAVNPDIAVLGVLITQFDSRLKLTTKILDEIKENGWEKALFNTRIRQNTSIGVSQAEALTIFEYDRKSNGALDYANVGIEIMNRIKKGL